MKLISKEEFIEYLEFIKDQSDKQLNFMNALEAMCPGEYVNTFLYSEYEHRLVQLLKNILNDTEDDIEYFLYELSAYDYDHLIVPDEKCPTDKNNKILYNSPETLYNYLVGKINE